MTPNHNLHYALLGVVKPDLINMLDLHESESNHSVSDSYLLKQMFKNFRTSTVKSKGLRLTYTGMLLLRRHYTFYKYSNNERISNQALLVLDKEMQWPYYVSSSQVVFFSENDAAWFRLNGENLNDFVDFL